MKARKIIMYLIFIYKDNLFYIKIEIHYKIMIVIIEDIDNYRLTNIANKFYFFFI